ncbi:hypothetical protein AC477_01880 [miscellaneous Crenarchaeota group-1 archaeon SG8-32-1]|uniref:Uncharacterized protein n=1 Tax=miscellaneous Crenarchaeota group-1 archaeon SG8-32-1 TaxID=1685124 RepID=A0A0M0BXR2_9ARCH|nr:MAG: hypothetical protein AC477_01880 [miscellaneous Crenarchaeota group-1 archaeon SG8-32-1]
MWSSKDLTLVIITAVVVLVLSVSVFQLPRLLTGIGAFNYFTTVGMAFLISLTFLLFEGRRWRFLAHNTLVVILSLPTSFIGVPFDIFPRMVAMFAGFPADIILNTYYKKFSNSNRLVWWSILASLKFFSVLILFQILLFPFYFSPSFMEIFSNVLVMMSPWIIGGAIVGGYLGYTVYRRIV